MVGRMAQSKKKNVSVVCPYLYINLQFQCQTTKFMINVQSSIPIHCHTGMAGDENKEIHQLHVKDIVLMQY